MLATQAIKPLASALAFAARHALASTSATIVRGFCRAVSHWMAGLQNIPCYLTKAVLQIVITHTAAGCHAYSCNCGPQWNMYCKTGADTHNLTKRSIDLTS